MKHLRTGIVVALVATSLVACGRGDSDTTTDEATADVIDEGAATGTVDIWAQGAEAEKLPELLEAFEAENPDVTVNVTAVPWGEAHDKYQTAIAGGVTPDIGQMGTTWMGEFGTQGAFAAVPEQIDTSAFFEGAMVSANVADGTYGVPWYVDTPVLYYRTDLAAEAGITEAPETWEDLKALATAYQEAGAEWGISLGSRDFQGFLPFAWSNGAALTSDDGAEWTIDTPEMVEAVEFFQSFFTEGLANPSPSDDPGATEAGFVDGSAPMFFGGPFEVTLLNEAGGAGFEEQYATAVRPAAASSTSFVGGSDLVVFRDAPNAEAAWKVIEYLVRPDVQAEWYAMTNDLPSVTAAWDEPQLGDDAKLEVFGRQLESVTMPPLVPTWEEINTTGGLLLEQVCHGTLSPADAVAQLQDEAESVGMEH